VSERSVRALWKTRAMKCTKWLLTATSTTKLTHPISFGSLNSLCSCFIKNAPRFARRRNFEEQTTQIASTHIQTMLQTFQADPENNWQAKDTAINLVLAISVRSSTTQQGVSEMNDKINVMEFFTSHVVPEVSPPYTVPPTTNLT